MKKQDARIGIQIFFEMKSQDSSKEYVKIKQLYWNCTGENGRGVTLMWLTSLFIYSFGQWLLRVHINVHDRHHYYLVLSIFIIKVVSA